MPHLHIALLAGGGGTRFWPLSRGKRPKQLLPLVDRRTLLESTWRRMRALAPPSRIWVVAPRKLQGEIARTLPSLRESNLILEPSPRDTAPAIGLACAAIARRSPEAVAGFFPTDHIVADEEAFASSVRVAAQAAERGALVCLGIRPDRPATGFGYLEVARRPRKGRAMAVKRFVEKPSAARARRFVDSGNYLWNGGMFVWRARVFLDELARTAPRIDRAVRAHLAGDRKAWGRATKLSVDYAVMEKARGVELVPLDAGWDDVGSWDAAARLREQRGDRAASRGAVLIDSPGSVVFGERRVVALVDLPDVAVIDTPDALLVVPRASAERVREVVAELERRGRREVL
jgi:mannose-1-phosphate guanylyltransferase/mannose-6-phosphate isomerase